MLVEDVLPIIGIAIRYGVPLGFAVSAFKVIRYPHVPPCAISAPARCGLRKLAVIVPLPTADTLACSWVPLSAMQIVEPAAKLPDVSVIAIVWVPGVPLPAGAIRLFVKVASPVDGVNVPDGAINCAGI